MEWFNGVIDWIGDKLNWIMSFITLVLPDSPFTIIDNSPIGDYLGYINYFIPFDFIIDTLTAWTGVILIYYGYQMLMRWAKAIE